MSHFITLIRSNIIKQTRSYRFFLIIAISIFLGILCVPGKTAGYQIFYLGGIRGVYNSAWLGMLGAVLPVILLWLPGFYLLRGQITEDKNLKIGQMIASSSISKSRYIFCKLLTNFSVLMLLHFCFLVAIILMQLILHESLHFSLMAYLLPMIFVTVPYLLVLASLTILFDVVPFLKNTFGNIMIFIVWLILSTMTISFPGKFFDLFGIGTLLDETVKGARVYYPEITDSYSFGYYPVSCNSTFEWTGVVWTKEFLLSRLVWIVIAIVITQLSVFKFNRFKESVKVKAKTVDTENTEKTKKTILFQAVPVLSQVKRNKKAGFLRMILGEMKIMLKGHSIKWYLLVLAAITITPMITPGEAERWIALTMLLPMALWAQMGNKDKACDTKNLILSSCSVPTKWVATWIAGVIVAILMSTGMFIRIALFSQWNYLLPWVTGILFVPTLAIVLGSISGKSILFEGIMIVLTYFGPINGMDYCDYMGLTSNNSGLFFILTALLLLIGMAVQILQEKRVIRVS